MNKKEIIEYLEDFIPDDSSYWNEGFRDKIIQEMDSLQEVKE